MTPPSALRALPSVQELVARLGGRTSKFPRALVVSEARAAIEEARAGVLQGKGNVEEVAVERRVLQSLDRLLRPSLVPVINATGVVLHTNLGRAPLGDVALPRGYVNLEYDLVTGKRGKRDVHTSGLLEALLDKPGIAVNNGAAATFLVVNEMAAGFEVVVSRGELIEIGDGFRIPDILQRAGVTLREVGTTNRTRIEDYRGAISERTRLIMRVHPSNFRMSGFTAKPNLGELVALGRESGLPVYEDLGSGNVVDLRSLGVDEPRAIESLREGVNLVSFSGDKLLGGPQAGIIAGDGELVARVRRNPLFRALRLDKIVYQVLEGTLRSLLLEDGSGIPALRMIRMTAEEIGERARRLFPNAEVIDGESVIGGGATPEQSIPTTLVVAACRNPVDGERRLRMNDPPIIARISNDRLLLDLRTVFPEEEPALYEAVHHLA